MTKSSNPALPACLLCGSNDVSIHHSLSAENIVGGWSQEGYDLPPRSVKSLLDEEMIHLCECCKCGFQFFNPNLAGSAEFYEQLHVHRSDYYAPDRPENERNARFAVEHGYQSILDIGCGVGFALDAAKRAGLKTYGLELSSTAAMAAAERGHIIFPVLLENLAPEWEGKFDLISLNQVLEHVPDPAGLVQQCVRFLSPRGAIAIAVPSATGALRFDPWLLANWPPHHISRWRIKNFYTLAERTHLRVLKTGGNQLLGSELQNILLEHRRYCQTLKKPYRGLPPFLIKWLGFIYRKTGMKYIFTSQGHSLYCYLSRP
jgi:2-polyprenyl-3-methyl-5-hydroxy-6-metoxy-1,4-benzoquinol methylase